MSKTKNYLETLKKEIAKKLKFKKGELLYPHLRAIYNDNPTGAVNMVIEELKNSKKVLSIQTGLARVETSLSEIS